MSKEKMKKIDINNDVWDQLHNLRKKLEYRKLSAVILWLLKHQSLEEGSAKEIDPEKILQDIIGEETWSQLQGLMSSHTFDLQGISRHLVDCHRLLEKEDTHEKLASRDSIEEIHSHVDKIRSPQELALSKLSVMDTPHTLKDHDHISDTDKTLWISCPVCYGVKPLIVEVDTTGNPLKKHEDGIEYKMVDGVLQRRFSAPDDDYLPVQAKIGDRIVVEESMAISTLKRLDKDLFNDFVKTLERTIHKFTGVAYGYQW